MPDWSSLREGAAVLGKAAKSLSTRDLASGVCSCRFMHRVFAAKVKHFLWRDVVEVFNNDAKAQSTRTLRARFAGVFIQNLTKMVGFQARNAQFARTAKRARAPAPAQFKMRNVGCRPDGGPHRAHLGAPATELAGSDTEWP